MDNLNKLIIGFGKPKKTTFTSWLIMTGYQIPFDHVYIRFESSYNRELIFQASGSVVNIVGEQFYVEYEPVYEFEIMMSDKNMLAMTQFAIDNVGKSYGFMLAIGLGIVRVMQLMGININNPFGGNLNTFVCSELAAYVLEEYYGAEIRENLYNITPKDLYQYMLKSTAKQIL